MHETATKQAVSAASSSSAEPDPPRPRGWGEHVPALGVLGLMLLTVGSMLLVWRWPDAALMHFWVLAQFVPVLFWLWVWVLLSWRKRGQDVD